MKPHIQQTLQDIDSKIAELEQLKTFITGFAGMDVGQPPAPAALRHSAPVSNGSTSKPARAVRASSADNIIICAKLKEPFRPNDFAERAGLSKNGGSSQVLRWLRAGYLKKVSPGQYCRTAKFPSDLLGAATHPKERAALRAAPEPKTSIAELEKARDDALKQRDHARANGRDSIVEVFQKDIDRIEAQIAAL